MPRALPATSTGFNVYVEKQAVDNMLERALRATGMASLAQMLEGPVAEVLHDDIAHRMSVEGDSKSGKWQDLSEATVAIREALGFPGAHPINVRTGRLQDFVERAHQVSIGAGFVDLMLPGNPPDGLTGVKLQTAQAGKVGNSHPGYGDTPARPVLAVDAQNLVEVLDTLGASIIYAMFGL